MGTHPVVICADDYALTEGISRGIEELLASGRISATSCMTVSHHWRQHAQRLRALTGRADIGLHLTLTDHAPLGKLPILAPNGTLPPLRHLLRRALARELPVAELNAEIDRQIAAFMEAFGRTPDFIDGHHHVHLLPVVRDLVVEKVAALSARSPMYLRSCLEPIWAVLWRRVAVSRTLAVTMLARSLARRAQRANISTNDSFRGINNFNTGARFGAEFRRFLQGSGRRPLIMCHPGHPDRELAARDRVVDQRAFELAYLLSDSFLTDLTTSRTRVARFGAMPEFDVPEPLHEL